MKQDIKLSINPLAEFVSASPNRKASIIKAQKKPNPFITSWYRSPKSIMGKFYRDPSNTDIIEKGLKQLKEKKPSTRRQASEKQGGIEILERFIRMNVPKCFKEENVEFLKPAMKSILNYGVEVITSPELLFKVEHDGKWRYGAVKFHASKSGRFTRTQAGIVSTVLNMYLKRYVAAYDPDAEVAPEYCLCVDVFNEIITNASGDSRSNELAINQACLEVVKLWDAA